MHSELFLAPNDLVFLWVSALALSLVFVVSAFFVGSRGDGFSKWFFPVGGLPPIVVALVYGIRGFEPVSRPNVHWIFEKDYASALRLGVGFDSIGFLAIVSSYLVLSALLWTEPKTLQKRASTLLIWLGVSFVFTALTPVATWLGMGLVWFGGFSSYAQTERSERQERRSFVSLLIHSLSLALLLAGVLSGVTLGWNVDFNTMEAFTSIGLGEPGFWALSLICVGLLSSSLRVWPGSESGDPDQGLEEVLLHASPLWISAVLLYRVLGRVDAPFWLQTFSVGFGISLVLTLLGSLFQSEGKNSVRLWTGSIPLLTLTFMSLSNPQERFLLLSTAWLGFFGVLGGISLGRQRWAGIFRVLFFLSLVGTLGANSAVAFSSLLGRWEQDPAMSLFLGTILFLFTWVGARTAFGRAEEDDRDKNFALYAVLSGLVLLCFGPLLSGRWLGGIIPGLDDHVEAISHWRWISEFSEGVGTAEEKSIGGAVLQVLVLVAASLGYWRWRATHLLPLNEKYPRFALWVQGGFGSWRIWKILGERFSYFSQAWVERTGNAFWDRIGPETVRKTTDFLGMLGGRIERYTDRITSEQYSSALLPVAKLAQWFHSGNVRVYGMIALGWALLFAIFLIK